METVIRTLFTLAAIGWLIFIANSITNLFGKSFPFLQIRMHMMMSIISGLIAFLICISFVLYGKI